MKAASAIRKKSLTPGRAASAIGVFDSGLGGLTIVRELRKALPKENVLYFGDLARLPYGTKSRDQIRRFSVENTEFLIKRRIKALVIACNSSSSAAYQYIKRRYPIPVIDVIKPAVEAAVNATRGGKIGVIGTSATIESNAYHHSLLKKNPKLAVTSTTCPLFVPLVEEGLTGGGLARDAARHYLRGMRSQKVDTVILGCTHYPLLKETLREFFGPKVTLIDSAGPCVETLRKTLQRDGLIRTSAGSGKLQIFVTDKPRHFIRLGERFLREKLRHVTLVR